MLVYGTLCIHCTVQCEKYKYKISNYDHRMLGLHWLTEDFHNSGGTK